MIMKLKDVKKGDFFTLKAVENPTENQVYIKGDYDRATKKYSCIKFSDMNYERLLAGTKEVFTDFTF